MKDQYTNPKLLLQFYRGQKVPPLVTKYNYENQPSYYLSKQLPKHETNPQQDMERNKRYIETFKKGQRITELQNQLQRQIQENRELRLLIKQLQTKLQKLKQVNQQLIVRVEQLQSKNASIAQNADNSKKQITRKLKIEIYKEVQDYLRLSVEKFTENIINVKMTPILQNRIQFFLEQILNINSMSVRKALTPLVETRGKIFDQKQADRTIKQIVDRYNQRSKEKDRSFIGKQGQQQPRPGQIVTRFQSPSKWKSDGKVKRVKIFSNSKQTPERSKSKQRRQLFTDGF